MVYKYYRFDYHTVNESWKGRASQFIQPQCIATTFILIKTDLSFVSNRSDIREVAKFAYEKRET